MEQEENQQEVKFCIKCWKSEIPEHEVPDVGLYGPIRWGKFQSKHNYKYD